MMWGTNSEVGRQLGWWESGLDGSYRWDAAAVWLLFLLRPSRSVSRAENSHLRIPISGPHT